MSPGVYFLARLRSHAGGSLLCMLAIALGVALGVAVEAINRSALAEFARGMRAVSGQADLEVRGGGEGFDERLYGVLGRLPGVARASPRIELEAKLAGRSEALRVVGIDPLQAAGLASALDAAGGARLAMLDPDAVFLGPAAAAWLGLAAGDRIAFQSGLARRELRVAGVLEGLPGGSRIAVMDIAAAQWRFDRLGKITAIALDLAPGANAAQVQARLRELVPPGVWVAPPRLGEERQASLSRAYRVNLNMLAMIGLLTGALLVMCVQALSVTRRRSELAFLRAAGMSAREIVGWLGAEGAAIGLAGSLIGVALGYAVAAAAIAWFGADLGAGFFPDSRPRLAPDAATAAVFVALGVGAATLGALVPARSAAMASAAAALRAGDEERDAGRRPRVWPAALALAAGAGCTLAPPVAGLPVFGYASILFLLAAALALLPRLAHRVFGSLPEGRRAETMLACAQLRGAPQRAQLAASGILASVALVAAMAILVASLRQSVEDWLGQVLPADVYVRASASAHSGYLDEAAQAAIAAVAGVRRVRFVRHSGVLLAADRPEVALIAREDPGHTLPVVERARGPAPALPQLWVSEAIPDLYGWRPGDRVSIPLGGAQREFVVAGVWRDYARSHGALAIEASAYRGLTGDARASVAEVWLAPGVTVAGLGLRLRAALAGAQPPEISETAAVRARSLAIFDRTFAVTYGMEAAGVVIALAAVAASFASAATLRRREFGMLRHLGMSRGEIARMLALEGLAVSALGVGAGLATGALMSVVLVQVVDRQSFHWSMDMSVPLAPLAAFAGATVLLASAAAVLAARRAMHPAAVRAVREDW
ncbi:MAG: FtsX-like permease family protein [Rhodocyclaceae bacterium]